MHSPQHTLDSFFSSPDQVLVLKGAWGVGKTYFWNKYIETRMEKKDLAQLAYSYVSLFGKTSLADIRAAVFQSGKPLATPEHIEKQFSDELDSASGLMKFAPWARGVTDKAQRNASIIGWLTNAFRSTPFTDKFSGLIASAEYGLVKNYLVCFDDLERKGAALSIRELMGLADELARRKGCKVVLILNDDSLVEDKDKKDFEAYREKVVDAELSFSPTYKQALACVLPDDHPLVTRLETVIEALELKNIRVIQRLVRLIEAFWPDLEDTDDWVQEEFINHASVLTWSYYLREKALPFTFVKGRIKGSPWDSLLGSKKDAPSEDELRYRTITSRVKLLSSHLDQYIIDYLQHGYCDMSEARQYITERAKRAENQRAANELNEAWKVYTNTFTTSEADVIAAFRTVLDRHITKLNASDLSSALALLNDFGEDVSSYVDEYMAVNETKFLDLDTHDILISRRVSYPPLLARIISIQKDQSSLDIDQVAMKIAVKEGWSSEDIEYLVSNTAEDYYAWIKTNPADLPTKLRHGLLFFGNLQAANEADGEQHRRIYANVHAALERLANESQLNRQRIKSMYGLKFDHEEEGSSDSAVENLGADAKPVEPA